MLNTLYTYDPEPETGTLFMERMHILIAEDESEVLQTMATILEMEGFAVSKAGNGKDALAIYEHSKSEGRAVDIVVTDFEMPGMSGGQLVETLRKGGENPGIMVVTAYGTRDLVANLLEQGVDSYLDKPYKVDDLVGKVHGLADKLRTERQKQRFIENTIHNNDNRLKEIEKKMLGSREFEVLGKLAEGLCHDLNNSLSVIVGFAELVTDSLETGVAAQQREIINRYVDRILTAANSAQHGIMTIQSFANHRDRDFCPVDLHKMMLDIITLTRKTLRKNVSVTTDFKAENPMVNGILPVLQHAMINLVFNANDAMPNGGTITIATANVPCAAAECGDGQCVTVMVSDTGTGMTPEVRSRAFEPFYTTKGEAHAGLGLASVLNAVDCHRGAVECESAADKGVQIKVTLPVM